MQAFGCLCLDLLFEVILNEIYHTCVGRPKGFPPLCMLSIVVLMCVFDSTADFHEPRLKQKKKHLRVIKLNIFILCIMNWEGLNSNVHCFKLNKTNYDELFHAVVIVLALPLRPRQGPQDVPDPDVVGGGSDPGSDGPPQLRHGGQSPPEGLLFKVHHLIRDAEDEPTRPPAWVRLRLFFC